MLLEVRGDSFSIWINDKEAAKNVFKDKEIAGDNIYVSVDFEAVDGDSVQTFGYDELEPNAPEYKAPTPAATTAAAKGGKTSP